MITLSHILGRHFEGDFLPAKFVAENIFGLSLNGFQKYICRENISLNILQAPNCEEKISRTEFELFLLSKRNENKGVKCG